MIIDFHTHIFSPDVRARRKEYARRDATFAEMYGDPEAKIAVAEDLLASMDAVGIDVSVTLGFAWRAEEDVARHNDYLLEAAAKSGGRLVPFATVNMAGAGAEAEIARCAAAGARGLGELRPDDQGWDIAGETGDRLAAAAGDHGLVLLVHVTEEGGHDYPGKRGCTLAAFRAFARRREGVAIVGAHLGGDAYRAGDPPPVYVDTAAQQFLYRGAEAKAALAAVPDGRLLFGSDFPLVAQERALAELRASLAGEERLRRAAGANAEAVLGAVSADSRP